ncbi:hypothetical protein EJ06DRAFT_583763 [Trichodelitschia bisporula]|uniref:Protein HRI1 n=1 Tax=Trichodelitschia bisporula TaxID=703511 RepID=A0A6G1HR33_9PEZI|nr:hypothetical protein EJ06DRAFT_583763 [Trichodelitschia bisporula]
MASISHRLSIHFSPSNPSTKPTETTSTLVLTSPTGLFVDMRIPLPLPSPSATLHPLPPDMWAFAGCTYRDAPVANGSWACAWSHAIDTLHAPGAPRPKDEGTMFPLLKNRTREVGAMENPDTGRVEEYEEMWEDEELVDVGDGIECAVARWWTGEGWDGEREMKDRLGLVVRVGKWAQGIVRDGEGVWVERWEWADGGWRAVWRGGSGDGKVGVVDVIKLEERGVVEGRDWIVAERIAIE